VLTYGIGANYITDMVSKIMPEDTMIREVLEGGFFNILMNKALSSLYGDEVNTDFSDSLRLLEAPNFFQFFENVIKLQVGEIATASPSVSLFFGDSPRITRFVQSLSRPFTVNNERKPE